ncbi:LPD7 domain-containing protein (plasmid) [Agrobacterium sp. rho-13.3]|uniref:LPD7 domain-containing protein n=1 Tax=Agrobacterium sp. rho-13.3 TaxID=3072980 RepID=UPI002A0DD88F|nr:LPD7 domain-containing protein [Agrobacterium sp. rho-13.3]MDX8311520.1 LPD7 domain-containing protein [Agrobacterium sp. rho-13.3]
MATLTNDAPEAGLRPAFGVTMIDDKPATSLRFERSEREGGEAFTVSFHLGGKQVARFKDLDASALDSTVGEANGKAIRERAEQRGTLTGETLSNAYGLSPAELASRAAEQAARDAGDAQAARAGAFREGMQQRHPALQEDGQWTVQAKDAKGLYRDLLTTDDAHEAHRLYLQGSEFRVIDNKIKDYAADYDDRGLGPNVEQQTRYHGRSTFQEVLREKEPNVIKVDLDRAKTGDIDVGEALDAAKAQRERDRHRGEMEAGAQRVAFLEQDAKRRDRGNDLDELAGRKPDFSPLVMTEDEKNRRIELTERIHSQFRVHGSEFRFKDQPAKTAFRDAGDSLKTATNDDRVAKAMVTMADAKGWKTISVSGHPDFRREAWLEASLRGMEVKGYKPQQQDLQDLATMRERQERNVVAAVPERVQADRGADKAVQRPQEAPQRAQEPARGLQASGASSQDQQAGKSAVRAYAGILLAHGAANYKHDPQERPSYFVTLATAKGAETVWGKDLQRSFAESGVKVGEAIKVAFAGDKDVTVEANKRDEKGKVIGVEPIDTRRNSWDMAKAPESERASIVKAVAAAVMADKVKDPAHRELVLQAINDRVDREDKAGRLPPVRVFDHNAPAQDRGAERARPQVEREAERTR